jgi:hypothetical protein
MRTTELPELARPKRVTAALARLEEAEARVGEAQQQLFEANERAVLAQREAHRVLLGGPEETRKAGEAARAAWHQSQDDLALARQVADTATGTLQNEREELASVILDRFDQWRLALEKCWRALDAEAVERLSALRETETERLAVVQTHRWLISVAEGDVLDALARRPRLTGSWWTRLRRQSGEPYREVELLDALDQLVVETSIQQRLDAQAEAAREEEERRAEQREAAQRRIAEARLTQEMRLAQLRASRDVEPTEQPAEG